MTDHKPERPAEADAQVEQEIRKERKFTLAEAIGRMGGPGMMKGVSPVTRKQQAEVEIEDYLRRQLIDVAGVLSVVLLRRIKESELLLQDFDQPLAVLAGYVHSILESEYRLRELVREADMEWGRVFAERPYFDKEGEPPNPDDPCTVVSIRASLVSLLEKMATEGNQV